MTRERGGHRTHGEPTESMVSRRPSHAPDELPHHAVGRIVSDLPLATCLACLLSDGNRKPGLLEPIPKSG